MFDDKLLVVSSCNVNSRSFTCDTEIGCAVYDQQLVQQHYQNLWSYLFPNTPWPGYVDFSHKDGSGQLDWGHNFFTAFSINALGVSDYQNSAKFTGNVLVDPWDQGTPLPVTMPNGSSRYKALRTPASGTFTPNSLPDAIKVGDSTRLDQVVENLQKVGDEILELK